MNAKVVILALFLLSCGAAVAAHAPPTSEYEVKAAFLYNFAKFVEWPPEELAAPDAALVLCLLGTDPFGHTLDQLIADKQIGGHPPVIKRIKDAGEAVSCRILFVGSSERDAMARVAPLLARRGVLTVGELEGFAQQGGVIQFIIQDSKVRFQINTAAADRAGLKISAQLLKLALSVPTQPATSGH